jgi:hypothetical protein
MLAETALRARSAKVETGFASDRAPFTRRAHDLIAKPSTLWRIMRVPFSGLLLG